MGQGAPVARSRSASASCVCSGAAGWGSGQWEPCCGSQERQIWRPRPELNRGTRFCRPLRHHSATWPPRPLRVAAGISGRNAGDGARFMPPVAGGGSPLRKRAAAVCRHGASSRPGAGGPCCAQRERRLPDGVFHRRVGVDPVARQTRSDGSAHASPANPAGDDDAGADLHQTPAFVRRSPARGRGAARH